MITLFDKILKIYPTLTQADFMPNTGTIMLQNDSNGRGDYIKSWSHPTFPKPSQAQLDAITG